MSVLISIVKKNDVALYYLFNRKLNSNLLSCFMKFITHFGDTTPVVLFCLFSIFYQSTLGTNIGWLSTGTLILSQILVQILKHSVHRTRPYVVLDTTFVVAPPKCVYSFPSGHTNAAFCVALILCHTFPIVSPLFLIIATLVGISRIYLGIHYPTDVLIGGILAYLSFMAILLIV